MKLLVLITFMIDNYPNNLKVQLMYRYFSKFLTLFYEISYIFSRF